MPNTPKQNNSPSEMPDDRRNPKADRLAHEKELETDLGGIYGRADGDAQPDMTRLVRVHHSTAKKLLVGLTVFFAFLAAVSWAGVFFFSPGSGAFGGEGVTVTIEGADQVKSGELVTYAVRYRNGENVALGTASMELRLPKEFKLQSTDPAAEEGVWNIGSIAPGKEGMITVKGVVLAPMDKAMDLQAILTYRPADFNSEFQKVATRGMTVNASVLDLAVTGPAKVLPGDKVTLTFTYKNTSESAFEQLRVRAEYPANFIPEKSSPAATDETLKEWAVAKLEPGQEDKLTVEGTFASDAEGAVTVKGSIGFLDESEAYQVQKESAFGADVIKGDLVTALILNGKTDAQPVRFGDTLRYAITYKNTGKAVLGDVSLTATFETVPEDVVSWNDLVDKAKGVRDGNRITWTKKQIPSLGKIEPGDEGTLDFEVPFIAAPKDGAPNGAFEVTAWVESSIGLIDATEAQRTAKTAPVTAKAVSDAKLAAETRYFNSDDIPVGTGPLPPKVGETTTYRAILTVTNGLHELGDLKLTAKLPPNVRWTGLSDIDAGDLRFDAASGKMVWTLNWMPTNVKSLAISFDVAITPTADQQGRFPTLIDGVILEATDKQNGFPLLLSASPLTTSTENDEQAAGKGRVQ